MHLASISGVLFTILLVFHQFMFIQLSRLLICSAFAICKLIITSCVKKLEVVCSVDTQLGRRRQISFLHSVIYKMIFILNVTPFTPIGVMLPNLSSTLSKSKHHKNTPLSCIYFVPIFSCKLLLFMLPF